MFFERTGYRYVDILNQPIEAHMAYGEQLMKNAREGYRIHMMRDYHGMPIHNVMDYSFSGNTTSMSYSWSLPLQQPPRVYLQVAEKNLRGFGKGVKEAFSNSERQWSQAYEHQVQTGDAALDGRFNIYSNDPQAAYHALSNPNLRQLLMQCTEVDLTVRQDQIRFADPNQKNVSAAMGGMLGAMAAASNPSKMMELSIPVHEHLAQLLATTYQACA